jgi:homoserine kinase
MGWAHDVVRVRVPATSANLGPGFDALGLALTLYDEVDAWIRPAGLSIEISGEGADLAEAGEEHLVVRAMRAAFAVTGTQPPGIGLRCVNRIPHGRGLGSSAAAIVAGILAARALAGTDGQVRDGQVRDGQVRDGQVRDGQVRDGQVRDGQVRDGQVGDGAESGPATGALPEDAVFRLATDMEGHPDNVAACLGGGLTIAWTVSGRPNMVRLEPLPSISPVICVAPAPVRTEAARRLLPDLVPHKDAAANAGRSALLIAALTLLPAAGSPGAGWPDGAGALFDATQDWLHQDYRLAAMPETDALVRRLRAEGIAAVVSGAGPSVLALLLGRESLDYRHHLDRLGSIVKETGIAWHISSLDVERHGARVLSPELLLGS